MGFELGNTLKLSFNQKLFKKKDLYCEKNATWHAKNTIQKTIFVGVLGKKKILFFPFKNDTNQSVQICKTGIFFLSLNL